MSKATKTFQYSEAALGEFLAECDEILQRFAIQLGALEKGETSSERVDSIYRDVHSLKGSAFLFGFTQIGEISHAMETSLEPLRASGKAPAPELLNVLFDGITLIEAMVEGVRSKKREDFSARLAGLMARLSPLARDISGENMALTKDCPTISENIEREKSGSDETPSSQDATTAQERTEAGDRKDGAVSTIRVSVSLLDKMMTLMGEMVLVRNQVLQYSNRTDDLEFLNLSQRLDVVTGELQGEMMKTRMQPIGNVLNKFQRVVRDLARDLKKQMDLQLSGMETELDRNLLETIKDPLTHIIRNSCDHGIEAPEERRRAGKQPSGIIAVRSYHEGGQVIIEIADDGRGLHPEKIVAKAIEKNLITKAKAAAMSEREIFDLIFASGFSTAAQVTNVSGRGVGMDVVRSNVEQIGGVVELGSRPGKGTTIRLKIPLTLAIVPAMIVRCREDRYAIPQVKLVELVRVARAGAGDHKIEYLQNKPIYRLRGKILPLLDLKEILKFPVSADEQKGLSEFANIVVLNAEDQLFGLVVDEIQDTADIVVKPLPRFLKTLQIYSGATVLGDGSVAFILDVMGVATKNLVVAAKRANVGAELTAADARGQTAKSHELLLFRLGARGKYAVALDYVHRLEEFRRDAIEYSGDQRVMRYRDSLLPLISINTALGFESAGGAPSEVVSVIVLQKGKQLLGIEVNEILDVLSTDVPVDKSLCDRPGIQGNVVANSEVVVVVDTDWLVTTSLKRFSAGRMTADADSPAYAERGKCRVLFAEDIVFFRKHVAEVLSHVGYDVTVAEDGEEALRKIEAAGDHPYDILLSDIEMPKMGGLDLARTLRKDPRWKTLPMVALTTAFDERRIKEGKSAGFDEYLEKMNDDEVIRTLDRLRLGTR